MGNIKRIPVPTPNGTGKIKIKLPSSMNRIANVIGFASAPKKR